MSYLNLKKICFSSFVFWFAFVSHTVLAQNFDEKLKNPIDVKVSEQNANPLLVTITNTDNSDSLFQVVNYAVQNTADKAVLAYTVIVKTKSSGKISTINFNGKLFQPNSFYNEDFGIEWRNLQPADEAVFSIDYVLFEDGSSWGADTEKESERILGSLAGRRIASENMDVLLDNQKTDSAIKIIKGETANDSAQNTDSKQSDRWKAGFQQGYNSVLWQLKSAYEKGGMKAIAVKIEEIKTSIKTLRK